MTTKLLNFSNKSGKNVEVTGQRTVEQNRTVGGASRSQHLQDNAADIRINGGTATQTADAARGCGEFNRVNQYTNGRGVHVDLKQATRSPTGVTWTHVDALGSPVAVKKPRPWPGLFVCGEADSHLTPHHSPPDATTAAGTSATTNPPHHPPR
ncbi:D-Ala-D-Ala carboxypeptidase family metallohydrolase [Stenotrophomonas bentonitica]|uniref:D-Ala-D-Ala carboxypeptidase family metallohydrolase n=1 Tax=Stenotrophomonas bentonitica TaxID=1450134 RepID=UPI003A5EF101